MQFEFMGFVVGNGCLGIPDARIHQLREYVRQKMIQQLCSFMKLVTFYSRFVPHFAN